MGSGPYGSAPGASGPYGSAPGSGAYGSTGPYGSAPGSGAYGSAGPYGSAPGGSGYGSHFGPGGTAPLGTPAGSGYGPGGTSPYGTGPGGSAYGPGGTSPYGTGPGGSAYGPGGTSPYGTGPGGTAPYGTGPGGTSPYGTGPGASGYGTGTGIFGDQGSDAIGQAIGDWTVRREIARGGMAVVYEAAKEDTGERSAVKVLLPSGGEVTEKKLRRFMREIDANKRLSHANIARIIDSGVVNGYPFFSMEYVEGKSLDRLLKDDLDLEIGMEVLEKIALAIHFAHDQGIIHRDLKPANVLVDDTGEELEPKITDFGLAKTVDASSSLTRTGAVIGTPYYLSPEQAQGLSDEVDHRADIYALGVIMYELATGRLPFVGQTTVELYNRIVNDDPVPPTKFKPQLTRALETVCLKAMAKDPADRYDTAEAFAADVRALLAGAQISAKVEGRLGRSIKAMRKKASLGTVLIATSVVLVLLVGTVFLLSLRGMEKDRLEMTNTELTSLEARLDTSLDECDGLLATSATHLREGRIPSAVKSAKDARAALRKVEEGLETDVTFEENREPAAKLLEAQLPRRQQIEARALVLLAKGTMLLDEGDPINDAQGMLEKALDVKQDDVAATTAQGDLDALQGKLEDALESYDEALSVQPEFVEALQGKARALFLLEDFDQVLPLAGQAIKILEKGEATDAKTRQIHELKLLRARTYREMGDATKGLKEIRAVIEARPEWWEAKACEGTLLALQGYHFKARDALTAAVELAGDGSQRAGPLIQRAEVLLSLGRSAEALHDASEATEFDPVSLKAVVVRAEASEYQLLFAQALDDAMAVLVRARERHWRVAGRAARIQARLEAIEGRVKEALEFARKAQDFDEYSSEGRLLLARLQLDPSFEDQYLEDAEQLFKQVLQQRPKSLRANRGLGLIQLAKNAREPQRAKSKLEEALKHDEDDPWGLSAMARVYDKLGDDDRSRGNTVRAARFERDVRRPEGYAYALGLRQQKLAQRSSGTAQADHLKEAARGYRWAAWLDPLHTQALTGLASIAYELEDYRLAGARLERALAADPNSTAAIMLNAQYYSAQDVLTDEPRKAVNAVASAVQHRGSTPQLDCLLETLKAYQALEGAVGPEEVDLPTQLKKAREAFKALRASNPWLLHAYRQERDLVQLVGRKQEDLAADATDRYKKLHAAESERRRLMETRSDEATAKLEEAQQLLEADKHAEAFKAANLATRQAPWRADVWMDCAKVRGRAGDAWAAVAAGLRAAYLDDQYAPELFGLLRVAGRSSNEADPERMVSLDAKALPVSDDLIALLRASPAVARSLVSKIDMQEARETKTQLETVIDHDPSKLAPHVLLGLLAYGGGNEELAIQHLLFVANVNENAGEAFYLCAVASVSKQGSAHLDAVHAIEWLQDASASKFDWTNLAKDEPRLQKLKSNELWQRLPEAQQAQ
jgi:tetratricopeptide (TPR) repeat protein